MKFNIVIPARWESQRLPGKPLLDLCGKSILHRVYLQAQQTGAEHIIIATDDERISDAAKKFGARVCMTGSQHRSGTDRICEVAHKLSWDAQQIVVNVQGDEPLIEPELINQVALALTHTAANVASLYSPVDPEHALDSHTVKLVHDKHGLALYFSRSSIPFMRHPSEHLLRQHIGIYAYRVSFLRQFLTWESAEIEQAESLEQLRILYHGEDIYLEKACAQHAIGVDTQADLDKLRKKLES
jgi:3-deoxy-manno-octulosonate cytidylyltransferase (CMP-KDO synthetase)